MAAQVTYLYDPTLVLNKNWNPITVCSVRKALGLVFKDAARVIAPESYTVHDFSSWSELNVARDEPHIRTVALRIRVPEVILLMGCDRFVKPRVVFSRRNLFRRDRNACQYCGSRCRTEDLSIDHVIPRAAGGRSNWLNCVVACIPCNTRKGNRTLKNARMKLVRPPKEPSWRAAFSLPITRRKASWDQFVSDAYWDVELEE